MIKWQILIPSVMVASTPLVALTGCTNSKRPSGKLEFDGSSKEITVASGTTVQPFSISWSPNTHKVKFDEGSLEWKIGDTEYSYPLSFEEQTGGVVKASVNDTLDPPITEVIHNAKYSFIYQDLTVHGKKNKAIITDVLIKRT